MKSNLLELAEDVGIFRRDAGGLQDSHSEGKNITDPEMFQSCIECSIQTRLQWILHLI